MSTIHAASNSRFQANELRHDCDSARMAYMVTELKHLCTAANTSVCTRFLLGAVGLFAEVPWRQPAGHQAPRAIETHIVITSVVHPPEACTVTTPTMVES